MWPFFHDLGKVPDAKHLFIRTESGRARNNSNPRMSFAGISPGKGETFVFTFLISTIHFKFTERYCAFVGAIIEKRGFLLGDNR